MATASITGGGPCMRPKRVKVVETLKRHWNTGEVPMPRATGQRRGRPQRRRPIAHE
jgi:hypothetical protein